jgi:hypothetical protein
MKNNKFQLDLPVYEPIGFFFYRKFGTTDVIINERTLIHKFHTN